MLRRVRLRERTDPECDWRSAASPMRLAAGDAVGHGDLGYDHHAGGYQFVSGFPLVVPWDLKFVVGVNGLNATMLLLTSLVALAATWVAPTVEDYSHRYMACIMFIAAAAAGSFASLDLFFFYAFHELALIPTFLMIGIWGTGNRQTAAWKITIYLSIGSIILLVGLIGLYLLVPDQHAHARAIDPTEPTLGPRPVSL